MLKHITRLYVLTLLLSSLIILFYVALLAMLMGGVITLDFNAYNEGWLEVLLLGIAIIPSIAYIVQEVNHASNEYCKRGREKE